MYDQQPRPPEALMAENEELVEAIRLTVEYVGTEILPPIEGWSWYDALVKYRPSIAAQFVLDSSNADPGEGFTGQSQAEADDALIMDPLVRQISELRAALGDSEARRAELEAALATLTDEFREARAYIAAEAPHAPTTERMSQILRLVAAAPSVVLEDRDREVEARALEDAAGAVWPNKGPDDAYRASVWLRERSAAIRKGDTNV